jgi:hypothetical protein
MYASGNKRPKCRRPVVGNAYETSHRVVIGIINLFLILIKKTFSALQLSSPSGFPSLALAQVCG